MILRRYLLRTENLKLILQIEKTMRIIYDEPRKYIFTQSSLVEENAKEEYDGIPNFTLNVVVGGSSKKTNKKNQFN